MSATTSGVERLEQRLRQARIIPVVRAAEPAVAGQIADRVLAAGLDTVELTATTPRWQEVVEAVREVHPHACIGVGTVTSPDQARHAVDAGADFCVSPRLVPDVRPVLEGAGVPLVEGGLTPTELLDAASRGIAKLFPAHLGGVAYLSSLLTLAPGALVIPTGGIPLKDVLRWLDAGALAVGVGSDLTAPGDVATRIREALAS